jgi:hypothetical protein
LRGNEPTAPVFSGGRPEGPEDVETASPENLCHNSNIFWRGREKMIEVIHKSVVVHHCFLLHQISEKQVKPSDTEIRRYVLWGVTKEGVKQFRQIPQKCRCRKRVSVEDAEAMWANGSAEEVYKCKEDKVFPERDEKGYRTMVWCRFWTDAKAKIARIDMVTRADVERAYVDLKKESQDLIEEVHLMQMLSRAALIAPFRPDPFEGRVLFPFSPDERTNYGRCQ